MNVSLKYRTAMKILEFATKVYDHETNEMVRGGIRIAIDDKEAEVINSVLRRAHEARRFGIATYEGVCNMSYLDTPLADMEKVTYSYEVGVLNMGGLYESGSKGL